MHKIFFPIQLLALIIEIILKYCVQFEAKVNLINIIYKFDLIKFHSFYSRMSNDICSHLCPRILNFTPTFVADTRWQMTRDISAFQLLHRDINRSFVRLFIPPFGNPLISDSSHLEKEIRFYLSTGVIRSSYSFKMRAIGVVDARVSRANNLSQSV